MGFQISDFRFQIWDLGFVKPRPVVALNSGTVLPSPRGRESIESLQLGLDKLGSGHYVRALGVHRAAAMSNSFATWPDLKDRSATTGRGFTNLKSEI